KRQFNTKILSKGVIDSSLHYGIWSRVWWETVHLKLDDETKHFVIPYRLYMVIECELNNISFIISVVQSAQNPLKSGFQCTCNTIKSNIESNPSAAIKTCYQKIFETKTEYSGQAVMGFENEIIIRQLIDDVEYFPIFLKIENFNVVITSIGDLDENKFYGVGTGFISSFTTRYCGAQRLFVLKIEENQCNLEIYLESECTNQIIGQTPDDVWKQ
ncbi:10050_t:CDS:1, partial [Gigaspora margarita]